MLWKIPVHDVAVEGGAVAAAAAIVRPQHGVAFARQHREVVQQQARPRAELVRLHGAAVHLHDERVALARLITDRIEQDALDGGAIGALPLDLFLPRQREVALERVEEAGHARRRPTIAGDRHRPDVAESCRLVELEHDLAGARHERPAWRDEMRAVGELSGPP